MAIAPLSSDLTLNSVAQTQQALQTSLNRESTGKKLNSPVDGPAAYAIASTLQAQVSAYDAATTNVQTAFNATNVATGALQTTGQILGQLNALAVAGVNDFLSPTDRAALQAQANQLVQQANTIAAQTNFNGANLLSGNFAGPNAGAAAQATVTANAALGNGGNLVTQVAAANANFQNPNGAAQGFGGTATTDSTIQVQIVAGTNGAQAQVSAIDSATGQTVSLPGLYNPGQTVSGLQNVNIKLGNFSTADIGSTATIQIAAAIPANTQSSALQVQSGANEGNTTGVTYGNASAGALQIANINLSSSASSTNAIGQVNAAIQQLGTVQTSLGAQQVALQYQVANNDTAQLNTQAAASNLADANIGQESTASTLSSLQNQLALAVLAQRNVQSAGVLTLFGSSLR
jgi:flagellin